MGNNALVVGANVATSPQGSVNSSSVNSNNNEAVIQSCFTELEKYSAPSMQNICDIFNSGFKEDGNAFYGEHMKYCDLYGSAAQQYGQAHMANDGDSILSKALELVKSSTQIAVTGLKSLIVEEKAFKTQKNIADGVESKSKNNGEEVPENQIQALDTQNTQQTANANSEGFFTKIGKSVKSFFNEIFG